MPISYTFVFTARLPEPRPKQAGGLLIIFIDYMPAET